MASLATDFRMSWLPPALPCSVPEFSEQHLPTRLPLGHGTSKQDRSLGLEREDGLAVADYRWEGLR